MPPAAQLLKIGELARRAGVSVECLRFYEARDLLEPAGRTASGYRLYDDSALERLAFIRKAQAIGFSLEEIARIIAEAASGKRPCAEVRRMARERLEALDRQLEELGQAREELAETVAAWEREGERAGVVCGLIESLPPRRKS